MGQYVGAYDRSNSSTFPPLPVIAEVHFREGILRTPEFISPAIIDTGADISNVSHDIVTRFQIPVRNWENVWWPDGSQHKCPVYLLQVEVQNLRPITERFIDYGFQEMIFGRNLLNRWRMMLDPSRLVSGNEIEIVDL